MKFHVRSAAIPFPARSLTPFCPLTTRGRKVTPGCSPPVGSNVAILPVRLTVPVTAPVPPHRPLGLVVRQKVDALTLAAVTASLKVTLTGRSTRTLVALSVGSTEITVGLVLSGPTAAVVNAQLRSVCSAFPAASLTPLGPPTMRER